MTVCLGIPGRVLGILDGYADQLALVDVEGVHRRVNIGMLDQAPSPGGWILIHMGFAMDVIDEQGAQRAMAGLELMGRPRDTAEAHGGPDQRGPDHGGPDHGPGGHDH